MFRNDLQLTAFKFWKLQSVDAQRTEFSLSLFFFATLFATCLVCTLTKLQDIKFYVTLTLKAQQCPVFLSFSSQTSKLQIAPKNIRSAIHQNRVKPKKTESSSTLTGALNLILLIHTFNFLQQSLGTLFERSAAVKICDDARRFSISAPRGDVRNRPVTHLILHICCVSDLHGKT